MPFICMRRTDLDPGTFQVLDLQPNTSQRNLIYDPKGQTKYVSFRPQNDTVATTGAGPILAVATYTGLSAYLLDRVQSGGVTGGTAAISAADANAMATALLAILDAGTALTIAAVNAALAGVQADTDLVGGDSATGVVVVDVNANVDAGEAITIGGVALSAVVGTAGVDEFTLGADEAATAANIVSAINLSTNSFVGLVSASQVGTAVTLTSKVPGTSGNSITLTVDDATSMTPSGAVFSGGAGSGSQGSLDELLRLISGESFTLPRGAIVDTDGSNINPVAAGSFDASSRVRRTYDSGAFQISLAEGHLAVFKSATFSYLGITGAALVVYDNDGSVL